MKKLCQIIAIIAIISISFAFSACTADTERAVNATPTDTDELVEVMDSAVKVDEEKVEVVKEEADVFTEGVWIKKYPDDYACFKFETPEGFQIVCDPYHMNETLQPDIVLESHQDIDHADTQDLEQPYELITEAGEYSFDDVTIRGFVGRHNRGSKDGTNHIFVITINDITIAHFASQGDIPSDDMLEQIGPVDVLLIQLYVNPNYNKLVVMNIDLIISKLEAKIIIPEHCGPDAAIQLGKHLDINQEYETTGNLIVTRKMLDEIDTLRIISLDNSNGE